MHAMSALPHYSLLILFFAVSLLGSAIQAASGFGYGIFVMSVLPFFLPYNEALCSAGIVGLVTAISVAMKHRGHIRFKLIALPLFGYFTASAAGTYFLKSQADGALKQILGGFLIVLSIYLMRVSDKVRIRANALTGLSAGGVSGVLGALFGMSGPPIVVYLLAAAETTAAYIANIQIYFVCTNVYISVIRLASGMMNAQVAAYTVAGILGVFWGAKLGHSLFSRLDAKSLRMTVYAFMIAMGVLMLATA